jgi:hypothetical protein
MAGVCPGRAEGYGHSEERILERSSTIAIVQQNRVIIDLLLKVGK